MIGKNVLGIIFCNSQDSVLNELTSVRAVGSVPFGGRYRLVDFALSQLVNSGISKVGLVTKQNFKSLADHVGSGHPWDLARKNGGLSMITPFAIYFLPGFFRLGALKAKKKDKEYMFKFSKILQWF